MKDWQEWFRDKRHKTIEMRELIVYEVGEKPSQAYRTEEISVEELYQAFKARLEFETRES